MESLAGGPEHESADPRWAVRELGDQAEPTGSGDGLGAIHRAELAEDAADVILDGVEGDQQVGGDVTVRPLRGEQPKHLKLAGGQWFDQTRCRARATWSQGAGCRGRLIAFRSRATLSSGTPRAIVSSVRWAATRRRRSALI